MLRHRLGTLRNVELQRYAAQAVRFCLVKYYSHKMYLELTQPDSRTTMGGCPRELWFDYSLSLLPNTKAAWCGSTCSLAFVRENNLITRACHRACHVGATREEGKVERASDVFGRAFATLADPQRAGSLTARWFVAENLRLRI